jgi:hypothetical protein
MRSGTVPPGISFAQVDHKNCKTLQERFTPWRTNYTLFIATEAVVVLLLMGASHAPAFYIPRGAKTSSEYINIAVRVKRSVQLR